MRQSQSLSRRQLLSGAVAATLGLAGCSALQTADSEMSTESADRTEQHGPSTLVLTETTTHVVTPIRSNPDTRTQASRTASTSPVSTSSSREEGSTVACRSTPTGNASKTAATVTSSESAELSLEAGDCTLEDATAVESYEAIEWYPGGVLLLEDGAEIELAERGV